VVVKVYYVDVNVFVYWLGGHPEFGVKALEWIREMERAPRGGFITSTLAVYEVLVILAGLSGRSLKDVDFVATVAEGIMQLRGLSIEPLMPVDMRAAHELMERYDLDYEDALHVAVALRVGADAVISNDKDLERGPLKRVF